MLARPLVAAGIVAVAITSATTASASPAEDQAFLAALDQQGIVYPSPQYAVSVAREVCQLLDDGAKGVDVAREISKNNPSRISRVVRSRLSRRSNCGCVLGNS